MLDAADLPAGAPDVAPRSAAAEDEAAIRAVALAYIEGCRNADWASLERVLHPKLAKRMLPPRDGDGTCLDHECATSLARRTSIGGGHKDPQARTEIAILDMCRNIASVRVAASCWIDFLQMARVGRRWWIMDVLLGLRRDAHQ